jgi:hypothetical protein
MRARVEAFVGYQRREVIAGPEAGFAHLYRERPLTQPSQAKNCWPSAFWCRRRSSNSCTAGSERRCSTTGGHPSWAAAELAGTGFRVPLETIGPAHCAASPLRLDGLINSEKPSLDLRIKIERNTTATCSTSVEVCTTRQRISIAFASRGVSVRRYAASTPADWSSLTSLISSNVNFCRQPRFHGTVPRKGSTGSTRGLTPVGVAYLPAGHVAGHRALAGMRVYCLYALKALSLRAKLPHRRRAATSGDPESPAYRFGMINELWSMDIMYDRLADNRSYRLLTSVDIYSRECVTLEVAPRFPVFGERTRGGGVRRVYSETALLEGR